MVQQPTFYTWMFRILIPLFFGVILMPHHHHTHEDVCIRMDWVHSHAETAPASAECDNCCTTRFVAQRTTKPQQAKIQPIFLLSLLIPSLFFNIRKICAPLIRKTWAQRAGAFLPDDYHATPFGWRAPPFI